MKEFRIAKCLDCVGIREYAIFADGSRRKLIQNDDQYGKYFVVDNELNTECKNMSRFSFSGRIKDAVNSVMNGNGDCIRVDNLLGAHVQVVYFIDRNIGDELREKSIEGWKNTKFGWSIECGYKNTFSGYTMLDKKLKRQSVFDNDFSPITFKNKDEATQYIEDVIERARYYAKRIANKLSAVTNESDRFNIIDGVISEIIEYTGTEFSVISDFVFDMLTGDGKLKTFECNLDEMGYNIIQIVIH